MGHENDDREALAAGYRENLDASLLAYRSARARREAAQQVEEEALRTALFDAGNVGLSVRDMAALVRLPKTTVNRLRIAEALDMGRNSWHSHDPAEYVVAHNYAWSHVPSRQITEAPFTVEETEAGEVIVTMRSLGTIRPNRRQDDAG